MSQSNLAADITRRRGPGRPPKGQETGSVAKLYCQIQPTPRVRNALWLYLSGSCKSKREAALVAGITPAHMNNMTNYSEPTKRLMNEIQTQLQSDAADMNVVMKRLGRMAVGKMALLLDSGSEAIQFKAAQDLADRSPETQKTQRVEVADLTLAGQDAKAIAQAIVEAAMTEREFADVAKHGLVELDTDKREEIKLLHKVNDKEPVNASESPPTRRVASGEGPSE